MSIFKHFVNDASSFKVAAKDKEERNVLSKLTKMVYYQNVSFLHSLANSTTRLSKVNPHRKEKIFVQSSQIFFFFNDPFEAPQKIQKQVKNILSQKIHFKFAEAAAGQIVKLTSNLMKNPSQSDRDQYFIQQVLSSLGVLLELNCKICMQIISPKLYNSYLNQHQSRTNGFQGRAKWFYFVGFFFGTTVINHPPILQKGEREKKGNDAYAIVEKQLMKFIDIDTPIEYSVVFAKFKMLFLRYYDEYKFMYLTRNLSKEGFFDSIGGFFSKAASVVSGVATSVYSTAMDVYQNTIKPIAQTLTPVLTPFLPGSVGTVLKMVAQNSVFLVQEDQIKSKEEEYLKNFSSDYYDQQRIKDVLYPSQDHIFDYLVLVKLSDGSAAPQNYTGVLINENIILSQIPKKGQSKEIQPESIKFQCYFYNKGQYTTEKNRFNLSPLSSANENYYYFELDRNVPQFKPWFELDFKKDHASSAAFQEYLANRDIFMFSFLNIKIDGKHTRIFNGQVSKILKSTDKYFIDAFKKNEGCMGSPIFYVDKKTKKNIIIGTCTQDRQDQDIRNIISKNGLNKQMEEIRSTFLDELAFKSKYLPPKPGKNENSNFDQDKLLKQYFIQRNSSDSLDKFQTLRSQLESNKMTKPSILSLVGIFKTEGPSQTKYGVGLQISNNILLTLRNYVVTESTGSVYFLKDQFKGSPLDLDINNKEKFDQFPILTIGISDSDFVKIQFQPEKQTQKLNANFIIKKGLKDTQLVGGYFLEFDFHPDSLGIIDKVPLRWSYISSYQMEKLNFNSSNISNTTQRLYFAYQKSKRALGNSLGEYIFGISNPSANKINYIFEEMNFKINKDIKGQIESSSLTSSEKIILADKRRPLYFQNELQKYKPIGIILHKYEASCPYYFSGTGTLIDVTINLDGSLKTLKDRYMITCAHNFIFKKDKTIYDLSNEKNKEAYIFQYGLTKHIKDTDEFVQRFINLRQQNVLKNFSKVITPPKYKQLLQKGQDETTYDIAIVKLSKQPKIQKAYKLVLDQPLSQDKLEKKIKENIQNISLTGYPGTQEKFKSKLGIMFTESVSSHVDITKSQRQKIVTVFNRKIKHKLSSLGGNSGSSIILNEEVIGIHTTGIPISYSDYGCYNLATSINDEEIFEWLKNQFIQEARAQSNNK